MSIHVNWDNEEQTIIRWDFTGIWSWDAFFGAAARSVALRKAVTHDNPVSIILNIGETAPQLGGALNATHHAMTLDTDGRGIIAVVGTHKLTQRLAKMFSEAYADLESPIVPVKSLDDAYNAIVAHR